MARYILIDNNSGYIWGDSATMPGIDPKTIDAMQYARLLDESLGEYGREYSLDGHNPRDKDGYNVYIAGETIPIITDGQNSEQLNLVSDKCEYVGFISYSKE